MPSYSTEGSTTNRPRRWAGLCPRSCLLAGGRTGQPPGLGPLAGLGRTSFDRPGMGQPDLGTLVRVRDREDLGEFRFPSGVAHASRTARLVGGGVRQADRFAQGGGQAVQALGHEGDDQVPHAEPGLSSELERPGGLVPQGSGQPSAWRVVRASA